MLDAQERGLLDKHRAILLDVARQRAELDAQERASSMIVRGLEAMLPDGQDTATGAPAVGAQPGEVGQSEQPPPATARDAARAVMEVAGEKAVSAEDIIREMGRHGWVLDAKRPQDAIRTALLRMTNDGEAERVGRGLYRLVPPQPSEPLEIRVPIPQFRLVSPQAR